MIHRILVANRGEIAVRIIRTCRRLGIETVLGASGADLDSMAARLADQTLCLGPPRSTDSYLNVDAVIGGAKAAGAGAIHPGYGFLSENRRLAEACDAAGIIFIGATAGQLAAVGDKLQARGHAATAGLPIVPGGQVNHVAEAAALAEQLGWPILIKAAGGGGGRGIKPVHSAGELQQAMELAISEAQAAFADPRVYLERLVISGRHVEVQLLGDGIDVIHLGTRDCSVQRRYQKLVEEAPAPDLPAELRGQLQACAVAFGRHLRYRGLGTVEFLVDRERNTFYFLEMNARIQVEHPVTEAICDVDLVEEQIRVAEGQPLRLRQADVQFSGHAIECRLNAENWSLGFRPDPGVVSAVDLPAGAGIRVDTHMQAGAAVPPWYDSLLAKLIVHGRDRADAIQRMQGALRACRMEGIATNLPMHTELMREPEFRSGAVDTAWFPRFLERHNPAGAVHG